MGKTNQITETTSSHRKYGWWSFHTRHTHAVAIFTLKHMASQRTPGPGVRWASLLRLSYRVP